MEIISRQEASERGIRRFFTGIPCHRGHLSARSLANGSCLQCNRDSSNANRAKNPELDRKRCREWYAKNKKHAVEWKRNWISQNQETYRLRRVKYRGSIHGRSQEMYNASRFSAKAKKIPFELDPKWIAEKLAGGVCELTGIPFRLEPLPKGRQNPYTASLDRIVPERGYVKSNVRVILWALNAAFNSYGEGVYADIAKVYLARHGSASSTGLT